MRKETYHEDAEKEEERKQREEEKKRGGDTEAPAESCAKQIKNFSFPSPSPFSPKSATSLEGPT